MVRQSRLRVQKAKKSRRIILYIGLVVLAVIACWVAEKKYKIGQHVQEIVSQIEKTFTETSTVRGTVYDRNFKQIAVTMERVSVYARTREVDSIPETIKRLGMIFPLDESLLKMAFESGATRIWVAQGISQEEEIILKRKDIPGVYFQRGERRYYPNGSQAAHLIGYVKESIGLSGVEYYYDRLLASRKVEQREEDQPLTIGQDLVLTVDLKIQAILEEVVKEIRNQENATRVAAYVMESRTGEVVAGAQLPSFDPNAFTAYSKKVLENSFLIPIVIPDSFRVFLQNAAMLYANTTSNKGITSWSLTPSKVNLGGQLRLWEFLGLNDSLAEDFSPSEVHVEVTEARAVSGYDDPELASGLAPESVSPLNLLTAFSVLLNGGHTIKPFLVTKVTDIESGRTISLKETTAESSQNMQMDRGTVDEIGRLFRSQSAAGPGRSFLLRDRVSVLASPDSQLKINDMTVVSIPAEGVDLVMLIVVERTPRNPEHKRAENKRRPFEQIVGEKVERISILQQVAKSVSDYVEPDAAGNENYLFERITRLSGNETAGDKEEWKTVMMLMPDLKGLSLRKSLRLLQGVKVKINIQGTGRVVSQKPAPETSLLNIDECFLILEKDKDMKLEKMSKTARETN